jgi:hypothetical protein
MIIGVSLYYFVFEMRKFKIKIESENHYECHRSLRIDKKIFTAIIITYMVVVVLMELVVVLIEA